MTPTDRDALIERVKEAIAKVEAWVPVANFRRLEADLISLASPSPAQMETGPRGLRWCQPPDDTHDRIWIVRFADQDRGEAVFKGPDAEAEARAYFERAWPAWTCWLFATAPWPSPSPAQWPEDVVERVARAICLARGQDPDDDAPISVICTADNKPLPHWCAFEEEAVAALATLPPPEDERVKGLVDTLDLIMHRARKPDFDTTTDRAAIHSLAFTALASYRGGA